MKSIYYLIICCLFTAFSPRCVSGQTHTIEGHVYDSQSREALSDVYVMTPDTLAHTLSDESGYFKVKTEKSTGQLRFSLVGYAPVTIGFDEQTDKLDIPLTPANVGLSEIVITSSIGQQKKKTIPGAIAVITDSRLKLGSGVSLQTSFNSVPGVRMDQSGLSDSRVSIRGNGIRAPWGIRDVKVYINGIPVTETDGTTRLESIDMSNIGRVEIIKGPASSIYGGNALGGVINFQLERAPYGKQSIETSAVVGSYGLARLAATYRSGTDKVNSFVSYGWQKYDGYRDHNHDMRRFLAGNFEFFPSNRQKITLLVNRTTQHAQIPGALTKAQVQEDRRQASATNLEKKAGRYQTWTRIGLGQTYDFNPQFSNSTSVFTYFYDLYHPLPFAVIRNFYQSYGGRTVFTYEPGFDVFDTEFYLGGEFNQGMTKGTFYNNNHGQESGIMSNVDYENTYYTLFYQSKTKILPKTTLTLGLSYNQLAYDVTDYLNEDKGGLKEFEGHLSPRIALSHNFGQALSLHLSASTGFSAPTTNQIQNANGTLNRAIDAEKAVNYELNAKGMLFDKRLSYNLSLYAMAMEGELIGQNIHPGVTVYHNAGKTSHDGVELGVEYYALKSSDGYAVTTLKPFLSVSYSHFRFEDYKMLDSQGAVEAVYDGNELTGIAPWRIYFGVIMETESGIYASANYTFTDRYPLNDANTVYNPAYQVVNAKLGYKTVLWKHVDLNVYAGLNNVTNSYYSSFTAINAVGYNGAMPAYYNPSPGINGYAGLEVSYDF